MPLTLPAMTESTESMESQVSLYTKNKHLSTKCEKKLGPLHKEAVDHYLVQTDAGP